MQNINAETLWERKALLTTLWNDLTLSILYKYNPNMFKDVCMCVGGRGCHKVFPSHFDLSLLLVREIKKTWVTFYELSELWMGLRISLIEHECLKRTMARWRGRATFAAGFSIEPKCLDFQFCAMLIFMFFSLCVCVCFGVCMCVLCV